MTQYNVAIRTTCFQSFLIDNTVSIEDAIKIGIKKFSLPIYIIREVYSNLS